MTSRIQLAAGTIEYEDTGRGAVVAAPILLVRRLRSAMDRGASADPHPQTPLPITQELK